MSDNNIPPHHPISPPLWAKAVFDDLEAGLLELIRAADLLALHTLAKMRGEDPPKVTVDAIMQGNRVSSLLLARESYTKEELRMLRTLRPFRRTGEQIVMATYNALEIYLVEKFSEYFLYLGSKAPQRLVSQSLEQFSFRSLDEIRRHYSRVFQIYLPAFEFDFYIDPETQFKAANCWEALKKIAAARNEIAHKGQSLSYYVGTPLDFWYPFDFTRQWVGYFEANFNPYIYEGRETSLIREYKSRVVAATHD
jgi:hypothetical protein